MWGVGGLHPPKANLFDRRDAQAGAAGRVMGVFPGDLGACALWFGCCCLPPPHPPPPPHLPLHSRPTWRCSKRC